LLLLRSSHTGTGIGDGSVIAASCIFYGVLAFHLPFHHTPKEKLRGPEIVFYN
jgi:hypothetical protein